MLGLHTAVKSLQRRSQYRLDKIERRLEMLEGYIIVFLIWMKLFALSERKIIPNKL